MTFKKIIMVLSLMAIVIQHAAARAAEQGQVHALRIIGPDGGTSLLIGSLHIGDPRLAQPDESILVGADRLVLEDLPDDKVSMSFARPPASAFGDYLRTGQFPEAAWASSLTPDDRAKLRDPARLSFSGRKYRQHSQRFISECESGAYRAARIAPLFAAIPPVSGRYGFSVRATQRASLGSLRDCHSRTAAIGRRGRTVSCQRDSYSAIE